MRKLLTALGLTVILTGCSGGSIEQANVNRDSWGRGMALAGHPDPEIANHGKHIAANSQTLDQTVFESKATVPPAPQADAVIAARRNEVLQQYEVKKGLLGFFNGIIRAIPGGKTALTWAAAGLTLLGVFMRGRKWRKSALAGLDTANAVKDGDAELGDALKDFVKDPGVLEEAKAAVWTYLKKRLEKDQGRGGVLDFISRYLAKR